MNKQLSLVNSNLDRIFRSPLSSFVDEFFSNELPLNLINREDKFPRYNIYYAPTLKEEGNDDNLGYDKSKFIIDLALAGYSKENLDVYVKDNTLFVEDISCRPDPEPTYLYNGITNKYFKWSLKLPKHAKVQTVKFINGLLRITVQIKVPEQTDDRIPLKITD